MGAAVTEQPAEKRRPRAKVIPLRRGSTNAAICDPNAWERSQTLFASWKAWAERSGQFVGDIKTFRDRLDGRDGIEFRKQPGTKRAGFQGVRLRPPEEPPIDPYYDR